MIKHIKKIKEAFYATSLLRAWLRLQTGDYKHEDIKLLEHEYFASRFEGIFKTDYRTAHNATLKSGRIWTPE